MSAFYFGYFVHSVMLFFLLFELKLSCTTYTLPLLPLWHRHFYLSTRSEFLLKRGKSVSWNSYTYSTQFDMLLTSFDILYKFEQTQFSNLPRLGWEFKIGCSLASGLLRFLRFPHVRGNVVINSSSRGNDLTATDGWFGVCVFNI